MGGCIGVILGAATSFVTLRLLPPDTGWVTTLLVLGGVWGLALFVATTLEPRLQQWALSGQSHPRCRTGRCESADYRYERGERPNLHLFVCECGDRYRYLLGPGVEGVSFSLLEDDGALTPYMRARRIGDRMTPVAGGIAPPPAAQAPPAAESTPVRRRRASGRNDESEAIAQSRGAGCAHLVLGTYSLACAARFVWVLLLPEITAGRSVALLPIAPAAVGVCCQLGAGVFLLSPQRSRGLTKVAAVLGALGAIVASWGTCFVAFVFTDTFPDAGPRMIDWIEQFNAVGKAWMMLWLFLPLFALAIGGVAFVQRAEYARPDRRRGRRR